MGFWKCQFLKSYGSKIPKIRSTLTYHWNTDTINPRSTVIYVIPWGNIQESHEILSTQAQTANIMKTVDPKSLEVLNERKQ